MNNQKSWSNFFWEAWCFFSILGIWPRHIEPRLLSVTKLYLPIANLTPELNGLKILQISDLHIHKEFPEHFLKKIISKINKLEPDLIVFTGDFLCRSNLDVPHRLKHFLCSLKSKIGNYAVLGNHDYSQFVTLRESGEYDVEKPSHKDSDVKKGFKKLFGSKYHLKRVAPLVKQIPLHNELTNLLSETSFKLLHNETTLTPIKGTFINISGMGEYTLGKTDIEKTYHSYRKEYFGMTLVHNPDAVPLMHSTPGEIVLCGHTHGGQVNLPYMWKKFTYMEHPEFKRGLKKIGNKWIYINRGLGSVFPFRWFSLPEISLIILKEQ